MPFISNLNNPTCASKRDVLELAILRYVLLSKKMDHIVHFYFYNALRCSYDMYILFSKKVDHTVHIYYCTTLPIIHTHLQKSHSNGSNKGHGQF